MATDEEEELVKKVIKEENEKELSGEIYEKLDAQTKNNLPILNSSEIHFENLNQGEFKKEWYFGKLFKKNPEEFKEGIILNKNILLNNIQYMKVGNKILPIGKNEIKDIGLNYKHKLEPQNNFWSNDGEYSIKEYFKSEKEKIVDKEEYYKRIYNKIDYFMDLKDKEIIDVATCWIIGSYCYELFETYGYLYFKALRESGKSKFKKILRLIGFNGQEASSITEASFFRTIENTKGVLCLDEYEKMDSERKKATDLLLNAGIEKGSSVKRYDVDLKANLNFDVYCPKIICNITGLNPTTMSRCIVVELVRTITKKGKLKPRIKDQEWQLLRNMSYCFVMENWEEIKKTYENYDYSQINNRAEDLWRPILSIAKVFGDDKETNLKNYCERITKKLQEDEIEDDIDYILLLALTNLAGEKRGFVSSKEIVNFIKSGGEIDFGERSPERVIGWHLRNFNVFKHKTNRIGNGVTKGWELDLKEIIEVMDSRGFPIPEKFCYLSYLSYLSQQKSENSDDSCYLSYLSNLCRGIPPTLQGDPTIIDYANSEAQKSSKIDKINEESSKVTEVTEGIKVTEVTEVTNANIQKSKVTNFSGNLSKILLKNTILELEERIGKLIPLEEIYQELKDYSEEEVNKGIDKLKQEGYIFEPREGYIQKI